MILIIYSQSVIVVVILFYLGFLSRTFAIHRTSGEEGEFLYLNIKYENYYSLYVIYIKNLV